MKVINYDFENIGGLLQMIAIPPTSFLRIRKDYNTGLNYLELRNREDIISIPVYANDTYIYNEDKEETYICKNVDPWVRVFHKPL